MLIKNVRDQVTQLIDDSKEGLLGIGDITDDPIYGYETNQSQLHLPCHIEYKDEDLNTGILFRDCMIDYSSCMEHRCIKKLV